MAGYIVLEKNHSSSSSTVHETRRGGDGVLYCTCPGWRNNKPALGAPKTCKHTKLYVKVRPGTVYGPPGRFQNEGKMGALMAALPDGKSHKSVVIPKSVVQEALAAPADWRALLLAEREAATARGMQTPPEAANQYALDLDLD